MVPAKMRAQYMDPVPKLMSRSFAADEHACVKATSFASEIAPELVPPGERALFMYATPRKYVASILAGENSVKELRILADSRAARMSGRVFGLDQQRSTDAHLAAAAWACEMTSLEHAADQMTDRTIDWADFDRMLEDMPQAIAGVAGHLGFAADAATIETIVGGPLMRRYSKAPDYDYSPALRRELIAGAVRDHGRDIDSALAMLRTAAEKSPLLARAMARAED
jgi:hypothetical protein